MSGQAVIRTQAAIQVFAGALAPRFYGGDIHFPVKLPWQSTRTTRLKTAIGLKIVCFSLWWTCVNGISQGSGYKSSSIQLWKRGRWRLSNGYGHP